MLLNILLMGRSSCSSTTLQVHKLKTCNSRQLAFDLTYEYHCTVGAVCLLAEGKKEQMNLEQKESYIEEKLAIAGSYLQWKLYIMNWVPHDEFLMVSITF